MKVTKNGTTYIIHRDDGTEVALTSAEVVALRDFDNDDSLRTAVEYVLRDVVDDGEINVDAFEGGFGGYVDEICNCFEDFAEENGRIPDDDEIREKILDEARYYDGMLTEEED